MADENLVRTRMLVLWPDGKRWEAPVLLPREPGYERLRELVEPFLDWKDMEHVTVLFEGRRGDMFVDECGALTGLPENPAATDIYYAAFRETGTPNGDWRICGVAVIFDRQVWF